MPPAGLARLMRSWLWWHQTPPLPPLPPLLALWDGGAWFGTHRVVHGGARRGVTPCPPLPVGGKPATKVEATPGPPPRDKLGRAAEGSPGTGSPRGEIKAGQPEGQDEPPPLPPAFSGECEQATADAAHLPLVPTPLLDRSRYMHIFLRGRLRQQ